MQKSPQNFCKKERLATIVEERSHVQILQMPPKLWASHARATCIHTWSNVFHIGIMGPQTQTSIARCKKDMHHICPRYFTVTLPSHLSRQRQRHLLHSLVRLRLLSVIRRKLKTVASFPGRACIRTVPVRDTLNVTTRHNVTGPAPGPGGGKR